MAILGTRMDDDLASPAHLRRHLLAANDVKRLNRVIRQREYMIQRFPAKTSLEYMWGARN